MSRANAIAVAVLVLLVSAVTPARAADFSGVNSLGLDASYDVHATFDWRGRTAAVRTHVDVTNSKPWSTDVLAFNLQTLRIANAQLTTTTVDGAQVDATAQDQTIFVPLDVPLLPGHSVGIEIDYTARMSASPDPAGYDWGFAATSTYLTGYRWIPWLSKPTRFNNSADGDPYTTATASHVHVAITADSSLVFASTGVQTAQNGDTREYDAANVRDFNFTASPTYRTASRTVRGTRINVFYNRLNPATMLNVAARAFNDFSAKVGRYPYDSLDVAEVGPWAAVESPMLSWLPDNAGHLLPWETAHETAHQWFYAVVGNDQAQEPFADEALVDFMARNLLNDFVKPQCGPDYLDKTIYNGGACYPWVVYVEGNLWLSAYRDRVGSGTFWRGVARYYAEYKFGMGGTRELLDALDLESAGASRLHPQFPRMYVVPVVDLPFGAR